MLSQELDSLVQELILPLMQPRQSLRDEIIILCLKNHHLNSRNA
jgi:hypothetical protein